MQLLKYFSILIEEGLFESHGLDQSECLNILPWKIFHGQLTNKQNQNTRPTTSTEAKMDKQVISNLKQTLLLYKVLCVLKQYK